MADPPPTAEYTNSLGRRFPPSFGALPKSERKQCFVAVSLAIILVLGLSTLADGLILNDSEETTNSELMENMVAA